jgi:hypothetical protein
MHRLYKILIGKVKGKKTYREMVLKGARQDAGPRGFKMRYGFRDQ